MPPEIEKRLSELVASAADKLSLRKRQEAQQQQRMQQMEDPIIQQRNRELDIQEGESQRKSMADQAKAELNRQKLKADVMKEMAKLQSKEKLTGTELGVRIGEALIEAEMKEVDVDEKGFAEGIKLAIEIQKQMENLEIKTKL